MIPESSLAWLAGFWDADGTFGVYKRGDYYVPSISVCNTDKKIIDHICKLLDSNGTEYYIDYQDRGKRSNAKPAWQIKMESSPRILSIIDSLIPYLVGKQLQAQLVSELCKLPKTRNYKVDRYWEIINNLTALNKRGRVK